MLRLIFTAALIFAFHVPASADIVRLKSGESIKGKALQERSNEQVLVVEDYISGAFRSFAWDAVDASDRDRIWEDWGWLAKVGLQKGHRFRQKLEGGEVTEVFG